MTRLLSFRLPNPRETAPATVMFFHGLGDDANGWIGALLHPAEIPLLPSYRKS